ncbi:hypothetical protein PU630_12610 [Microbacterium horticulturae]|uniref:Lipoprotein n=1 Tax=Microbacterium horticulturae TaxID=3028316 RepID=A0ABY8BV82_9MICO|nr:hypothetical protein [Microbacterium sp. KACC 23027]WEG08076.1 hypothetical protein PU630_12610 [Microbacterium sp. KACC 23027]
MSSRLGLAAVLICATALVAGCAPQPDPTPTRTAAFASEDEAFAAAEETYRAYVDALNNVDLSDPATFEDVYKWETGDRLSGDKKALTSYYAQGATMSGASRVVVLEPVEADGALSSLALAACVDVSTVDIRDGNGASLVATDRPDVQSIRVELTSDETAESGFLVSSVAGRSGSPSC